MKRVLALFLLLPSSVYADAAVATPKAAQLYATVAIHGTFSGRGRFDVNLINGPPGGGPGAPAGIAVSSGYLAALNRALPAAVDDTIKQHGFRRISGAMGGEMIHLVREAEGDRYFALEVHASPGNGLGGNYGGLDVVTRLRSLQRDEEIPNFGFATVAIGAEREAPRLLREALGTALDTSLRDFRAAVHRPIGEVELAFELTGLDAAQRAAIADPIAPCVARMAAPVEDQPGAASAGRVVRKLSFRIGR